MLHRFLHRLPRAARDVPIFINSRNRASTLRALIGWLRDHGYRRLFVLDNDSRYPPLLAYLDTLRRSPVRVLRLGENAGPLALWQRGLLDRLGISGPFVLTDDDVLPIAGCPADVIGHLRAVLDANPAVQKVGLGLRIDDLPASYRHRDAVALWEQQFWRRPAAPGLMWAPIDTTFALYRAGSGHAQADGNLRTTFPYLAAHAGWYGDSDHPSEEERFYARTASAQVTSWTREEIRPDFAAGLPGVRRPSLIHLREAPLRPAEAWPGWQPHPVDGTSLGGVAEGSVDGIYADAGFGPVGRRLGLLRALHRLAKPNARLVVRAPQGADAQGARAWLLAGQPAHEGSGDAYAGDWAIASLHALPDGDLLAHLYAVKPKRARARVLEVWSEPQRETSALSPLPVFDVLPGQPPA